MTLRRDVLVVAAFGALILVCQPLLSGYYQSLLTQAFLFAILALSVDLLWGYAGILSFGQSVFFGIGGYAVGVTWVHITTGWIAWPLALGAGVAIAALVALALGWFAFYTRARVGVLYIAVITLASGVVFEQVVLSGGTFTGASSGLTNFRTAEFGGATWYFITGALLVLVGAAAWRVVRSDAGRVLAAVRDNEERCAYLGFDVPRIKTVLFAVCGALAALAGGFYVAYTANIAPSLVGLTLATNAVIWTAVGGRATLLGPIAGALLINVLGASLNSKYPLTWQLFLGALFVLVVLAIPAGILPTITMLGGRVLRLGRARRGGIELVSLTGTGGHAESGPALDLREVSKTFGSLEALSGVGFVVQGGERVSVVGPNGAGKTTLVRCIADGRERSGGDVFVCGDAVGHRPPHRLVAAGVGRKFQAANVFESLTVAESLQLAAWRGRLPSPLRRTRTVAVPEAALTVLRTTGLDRRLDEVARNLGHGEKQALELAMVLTLEPRVLLLDEPTAGLTSEERQAIAELLLSLDRHGDLAIVLIEHDFEFVKRISTRMLVLHEGRLLVDGTVDEVAQSEIVRAVYLGHAERSAA